MTVILTEPCNDWTTNSWTASGDPTANGHFIFPERPGNEANAYISSIYTSVLNSTTQWKIDGFPTDGKWSLRISDGSHEVIISENANRFITLQVTGATVVTTAYQVTSGAQVYLTTTVSAGGVVTLYANNTSIGTAALGTTTAPDEIMIRNEAVYLTWDMEDLAAWGTATSQITFDMEDLTDWGTATVQVTWDMEA